MLFDFTMKSFRILLNAVPRWMLPFAYGGPSCKTNRGLPLRACRIRPYRSSDSHRSSILGSAAGRFAFIGNPVLGRLTVFFRSTEEAFMGLTFHRSGCQGYGELSVCPQRTCPWPIFLSQIGCKRSVATRR